MRKQNGAVLIVCMILLVMLTLLGVTAMSTSNLEIKMAKGYQDGMVAFHEAENGLSVVAQEMLTDFNGVKAAYAANGDVYTGTATSADGFRTYNFELLDYLDEGAVGTGLEGFVARSIGQTSTGSTESVFAYFIRTSAPTALGAALELHPAGSVTMKGNSTISGFDHSLPTNFDCQGAGCSGGTGSGPDAIGIYSDTDVGDLTTIGSPTLEGAPATQTGGGAYDQDFWLEYANNAASMATVHNGADAQGNVSWGTRDNPVIHVINENMMINGSIDGAGILILTGDGTSVTINGNFHFEGLIVAASTDPIDLSVGGTARIFGSVIAASPSVTIDVGATGTPGVLWSEEAIANLDNINSLRRTAWVHE